MMRRFLIILLIIAGILAIGWMALRRDDIPYATLEAKYANSESEFVQLDNGLRIHYRDEGPIDAPTLVLVHGFSASLHTWDAWTRDLSRDYRVIRLDLPGHGLSHVTPDTPLTMAHFASVVDEVTAKLDATNFVLAGSSMGGNTSWEFALAYPEKLKGLVLVGASGWVQESEEGEQDSLIFKLLGNPVARALIKDLDLTPIVRDGLEDSFADPSFVDDAMVDRYVELSRAPGHRSAILGLTSDRDGRNPATPEQMARISAPTLILHGTQDNLVPVAGGRKFDETIPNSEAVIYDNVGHLPQEEISERSASDLRAFLEFVFQPAE